VFDLYRTKKKKIVLNVNNGSVGCPLYVIHRRLLLQMNREILPSMLERNHGQIVAISSMSSMSGLAGLSTYTATKWATNGK